MTISTKGYIPMILRALSLIGLVGGLAQAASPDWYSAAFPVATVPNLVDGFAVFPGYPTAPEGSPALPMANLTYLLGPEVDLSTLRIRYLDTVGRILTEAYEVRPSTKALCSCLPTTLAPNSLAGAPVLVDGKDTSIYRANKWYPARLDSFTVGRMGGYILLALRVPPFQYLPPSKKLKRWESGRIRVEYNAIPGFTAWPGRRDDYERRIRSLMSNDTSVFALYDGPLSAKVVGSPKEEVTPEGLWSVRGGVASLPPGWAGSGRRIEVRSLEGRLLYAGTATGNQVRWTDDAAWRLVRVVLLADRSPQGKRG